MDPSEIPEALKALKNRTKGHDDDQVRVHMLGLDITGCGQEDFDRIGFSLLIRNGNLRNL